MTLKAGAATRDISPREPTALYGYPHVERISTGVHDPLLAAALYLEDGSGAAVLIALDILFLDPPAARSIRSRVAERTSVAEECVFISCTHTHSGPVTTRLLAWQDDPTLPDPDPRYLEHVGQQVVDSAGEAAARAEPAELAWTTADAKGTGGNRHEPDGVTDSEVGVLAVRPAGGGPLLGAAVVYGMHPTVMHEDSTLVSSDFPHFTRLCLRQRFGEDLIVVYHTAPCGNQSPRYFVNGQTFEEAERLGRKLGEATAASLDALQDADFRREVTLRGRLQEVDLPRRAMPSVAEAETLLAEYRAEHQRLKAENAPRPKVRTAECAIFGAEGTVALARAAQQGQIDKTLAAYRPIEIQTLRIGDVDLAGLPGELFTDYALQIKQEAPRKTFVVSLVNGELQGYLVTPEAAAAGGYEATNTLFSPQAGRTMVDVALAMLAEDN